MSPGTVPGLQARPPSARDHGGTLKLLLTSGGVTNPSIHSALVQLLGKPIAECHALCVPTAQWGHPMCGPASVRGFVAAEPASVTCPAWAGRRSASSSSPHCPPSAPSAGCRGSARPTCCWSTAATRRTCATGCASPGWPTCCRRCPTRSGSGVSAGSMVMTPRIGADFVEWPSAPDDRTLGVVDFSIFPHLNAFPDEHPGRRGAVGGRHRRPGLRHRRADGHQGRRRRRRGGLRRAVDEVRVIAARHPSLGRTRDAGLRGLGGGDPALPLRRQHDGGAGARDAADPAQPRQRALQLGDVGHPHLEQEALVAGDEPAVLDLLQPLSATVTASWSEVSDRCTPDERGDRPAERRRGRPRRGSR